jgi:predicted protein tyrosine phosphatase
MFKDKYETQSGGISANPVTAEQLEWADLVVVMEGWHKEEIEKRFPILYKKKKIVCLDIPDMYYRDNPDLIRLLKEKMRKLT